MELPHEPTSAWFMPFNMDPPLIGEVDASLFMAIGDAGVGVGGGGAFSEQGRGAGGAGAGAGL